MLPAIYLAGPWARRDEVRLVRDVFQEAGFTVNARWLDVQAHVNSTAYGDSVDDLVGLQREAVRDLEDVAKSAVMVVVNLEKSEGKAVEQGLALSRGMPIVVIGARTNLFQYLPHVTVVDTPMEAIRYLERRASGRAA